MKYKDRKTLEDLLGTFVTTQKHRLSDEEERVLRRAMRIIGRENDIYAELHII